MRKGHLAAWNYFNSVDRPQNNTSVTDFKTYCKKTDMPDGDKRVMDDPMGAAPYGMPG